jgi:hypothetical protein
MSFSTLHAMGVVASHKVGTRINQVLGKLPVHGGFSF